MTMTMRNFSAVMAVLILAAVAAPVLSGQLMDDQDRLLFEKFRMTQPDLTKGEKQLKKKQFNKAEETLLKVLKEMPENAEASFFLAETYYEKGDFEKGLEAIDAAEKNYPYIYKFIAGRRMSSPMSPEQQRLMQEIKELRGEMSGQRSEVQSQTIQTEIAAKQTALNELRQKEASQQNVEETYSLPADYSYTHGNLLFRLKRYDEALAQYEKAVAADPKHGRALNNIANIYYMARQYDKALEFIEKAEAVGAQVNPQFKKAVLSALGK
jgi:tetratricopeptide (TPR) repeat protein